MKATELVGKIAIREKPIRREVFVNSGNIFGGNSISTIADYSYCTDPVRIISATDHHVVIEVENELRRRSEEPKTKTEILDERFCDDNWTDYYDLMGEGAKDPFDTEDNE